MKKTPFVRTKRGRRSGFTLVEVLVSLAVLAVLLTIIAQVLGQVQRVWSSANSRVAQFREARRAMDRIVSNLSQATMNTYLSYYYTGGANPLVPGSMNVNTGPAGYVRYSELQFLCGPSQSLTGLSAGDSPGHAVFFQAPLGGSINAPGQGGGEFVNLPTALSACGYFVQFGDDASFRPPFLNQRNHPPRRRFRLMEYRPPIEANVIYPTPNDAGAPGVPDPDWYNQIAQWARPVAENIVYMVISPKVPAADTTGDPRQIASDYTYNTSKNGVVLGQSPTDYQLPPLVEVALVALDEISAQKFVDESGGGSPAWPGGLFNNATDDSFRADLVRIEELLNDKKLNYRIFTTTIPLRNSKWGL